jgi:hypothetical protein
MFTKPSYPTLFIVLAAAILLQGCGNPGTNTSANLSSNGSSTQATAKDSPLSSFERDLQFVRNGQYAYIWGFSRKDGKPLDKDDGAYLRTNAPQVVDWVTTDGGKRAIGGTNFDLELGNMNLLRKRFVVEGYTAK